MADEIDYRTRFAFNVVLLAQANDPRIFRAFATVRREAFLGAPPWTRWMPRSADAGADGQEREISGCDPEFVYVDDVIALDRARGIHNGVPSLHARCIAALEIKPGQRIIHVGAGTGYYSAILAELVGQTGKILAYEIDPGLAAKARANLAAWPQAELRSCSGTSGILPPADAIYVNAGAPYPCRAWLDALRPGGRLLFQLQSAAGISAMLLAVKPRQTARGNCGPAGDEGWEARFLVRANFIHCRDVSPPAPAAKDLGSAFLDDGWTRVRRLHFDDAPDARCWYKGAGWWLGR